MTLPATIITSLAPLGKLRFAINLGNPILARASDDSERPFGISVDIATELAKRLAVPIEFVILDAAAKSVDAVAKHQADVGFFAVDPVRAADVAFTEPYLLIEGCYLVGNDSHITTNEQVDTPGNRVMVGAGSAYDLFLTRTLKHAPIVRARTSPAVVETYLEQGVEVAAGVRQQLEADVKRHQNLRVLDAPFMVIRQAVGVAQAKGPHVLRYLDGFIDELKASGAIKKMVERHGIEGASPASIAGRRITE